MANVLINDTYLKAIGEAIRSKLGTVLKYKPSEMATAINNIQTLKGGGYKVNITQSEHQTITVSQPSFNNRTAGFTIDDYPSINVSLKADPGYIAGSLNRTNFTFSNDVREVDIFATEATYSPNITYNGNMNVFLVNASSSGRKIFCISNKQPSEFDTIATGNNLINESEFAIGYDPDWDMGYSNAAINNTNNFYNLDPNAKYKITNLKIGDTILTDADLSSDNKTNEITSNSIKNFSVNTSSWFNSVYKQCTGIDLKERANQIPFNSPNDDNYKELFNQLLATSSWGSYPGNVGGLLFEILYLQTRSRLYYQTDGYDDLSQDNKNQIEDSISKLSKFFTTSDNVVNITNIAVLEEVETTIENLRVKFKDNQTALNILNQYEPFMVIMWGGNITFKNIIDVDPDNVVGLAQELSCGIAQIRYWLYLSFIIVLASSQVDEPIISTIPVSFTFTNVTQ